MKKFYFTIFLFITITYQSIICQIWNFLPNEKFLQYDPSFGDYKYTYFNCMTIHKNKLAIRSNLGIMEIFDKNKIIEDLNKDAIKFTSKQDLSNMIIDTNFKKGIHNRNLWTIKYNNFGILWGSVEDFFFNFYSDTTLKVYNYSYYKTSSDSFRFMQFCLSFDKNNIPWVITRKAGIYDTYYICKIQDDKIVIQDSLIVKYKPWGDGMHFYYDNVFDKNNRLWQLRVDSVFVYENNQVVDRAGFIVDGLGAGILNNIVINSKNQVFLLTSLLNFFWTSKSVDEENYEWNLDTTIRTNERIYFPKQESFYNTYMCIDSSDNIWLTHRDAERLYRFDSKEVKWEIYDIPRPQNNTNPWSIASIQADDEGKIWVLVRNYGIFILNPYEINNIEEESETIIEGIPDIWIRNLYPNPATEKVRLEFFINKGCEKSLEAGLYNYLGERFLDLKPYFKHDPKNLSGVIEFPTDGIPSGVYFVCLSAGKTRKLKMLVVE